MPTLRWAVVLIPQTSSDFLIRQEGREVYGYCGGVPASHEAPHRFATPNASYFVDSEKEAEDLAKYLVSKWPHTSWAVSNVSKEFSGVFEKIKIMQSKWTEKGLLPCG